jgi:hypothetical protein
MERVLRSEVPEQLWSYAELGAKQDGGSAAEPPIMPNARNPYAGVGMQNAASLQFSNPQPYVISNTPTAPQGVQFNGTSFGNRLSFGGERLVHTTCCIHTRNTHTSTQK